MSQRVERIALLVTAVIAIAVTIADFAGALTGLPWLAQRIPEITLLLVALLVTFVAFEQRDYSPRVNSRIDESATHIIEEIKKLHGTEILHFKNVAQIYSYVATKLHGVSKSVDDITWGSRVAYRTSAEQKAYQDYLEAMEAVCDRKDIEYREISSLTDKHYYDRAINLIEKGYYTYNLGYYDLTHMPVPLFSYILFDRQEVVVGFYRVPKLPLPGEVYISITHPAIVPLFVDYFDTLWAGSTKIKDGPNIDHAILNQIKEKLETKDDSELS